MGSEIIRPDDQDAVPASSPEVDFALVLSRMIDSVKNDPEHLRATVYELARHKLKEQLRSESLSESRKLSKSLEVAIQGVESFSQKDERAAPALPKPAEALAPPPPVWQVRGAPVIEAEIPEPAFGRRKTASFRMIRRLAIVVAIVVVAILAVKQQGITIESLRKEASRLTGSIAPAVPKATPNTQLAARWPAESNSGAAKPPPPDVPTSYGIYAVSQDKLYELELLPGRVPDMRVAISPAILTPSRTKLPDGRVKFVVYRRDSATNAVDRAELRIVAKIDRELGFDPNGKSVVSKPDNTWVIRNISIPYRSAPKRDNPDMYEILGENPEAALSPGRYVLVLKGQAYDFSVAGTTTDPRQCLERFAATNGQFYSECKKP